MSYPDFITKATILKGSLIKILAVTSPEVTTHAATSKTTPVDADELLLVDSAASFGAKKLTWANLKTTLSATFAALNGSNSQNFATNNLAISGVLTAAGASNFPGFKNLVLNGACRVSQRAAATLTSNSGFVYGAVDRINGAYAATAGTVTFGQSGQVTSSRSAKSAVLTHTGMNTTSGSHYSIVSSMLESTNTYHLNSKQITLSARVGGSTIPAGTTVRLDLCKPTTTADTWGTVWGTALASSTAITLTDGCLPTLTYTLGAAEATLGLGIKVVVLYPTNASWSGTVTITDFQIVEGSVATPLEIPPYSYDLAQCQRYYQVLGLQVPVLATPASIPINMRAAPTVAGLGAGGSSTNTSAATLIYSQTATAYQSAVTLSSEL